MSLKKFAKIFFIFLLFIFSFYFIYLKYFNNKKATVIEDKNKDLIYNSNILKDIEYTTKDKDGNEYFIRASQGEIDFSNSNILFLTNVSALINESQ